MTEKSPRKKIISRTEAFVRDTLAGAEGGHDWWHVHRVRNLALQIAAEEDADTYVVELAALLHDITKPRSFTTGENHARTGGEYLARLGFPEVGGIVRQHVILDCYFAGRFPSEAELVNYSDKRVLHDSIVSLNDRMDYIFKRYATTGSLQRRARQVWRDSLALEKRIFSYLSIEPDQLAQCLAAAH